MLQAKGALDLLRSDLDRLEKALAALIDQHAETLMLGRTLLQSALPMTFGLKVASWAVGIRNARERLQREADGALMLQLGGAAGTLVGMGTSETAMAVICRVARRLHLGYPYCHGTHGGMASRA